MESTILSIGLCILLPLMLMFIYMEKRSRRMVISMVAGVAACLTAYYINTFLKTWLVTDSFYHSFTITPLLEELLKFIPIIIISAIYKKGRRGSAALAFSVGVGFCVVENYFYLISGIEYAKIISVIARAVGTGLMHCMSSANIGLGIYYGRIEKRFRFLCIGGSFIVSVLFHGLYNLLMQTDNFKEMVLLIPMCIYLLLFIFLNKGKTNNQTEKE